MVPHLLGVAEELGGDHLGSLGGSHEQAVRGDLARLRVQMVGTPVCGHGHIGPDLGHLPPPSSFSRYWLGGSLKEC